MIQHQDHQQEVKLALQVTILLLLKNIKHSAIAMAPRKETWSHVIILNVLYNGFTSLVCRWRDFIKARPSGIAQIARYYPNFKFIKERLDSEIDCMYISMYFFCSHRVAMY